MARRPLDIEESSDGQHLVVLTQISEDDPTQRWRSEVAVGRPDDPLDVTVRVRLGAVSGSSISPLDYEFGTPAIVRTILREQELLDGGLRMLPAPVELGSSDIPALVEWLADPARRLPVVVVSRTPGAGQVLVDCASLARELAGVGHVRVLAASQAAWALTAAVGPELSTWDGAVRVYFPCHPRTIRRAANTTTGSPRGLSRPRDGPAHRAMTYKPESASSTHLRRATSEPVATTKETGRRSPMTASRSSMRSADVTVRTMSRKRTGLTSLSGTGSGLHRYFPIRSASRTAPTRAASTAAAPFGSPAPNARLWSPVTSRSAKSALIGLTRGTADHRRYAAPCA